MHIVTDRLVLREFVIGDWPGVLAYQRDPRYLRFYTMDQPQSYEAGFILR